MKGLDAFIRGQLEDAYGIGTRYSIVTHSYNPECDLNPEDSIIIEDGLLYGNDECIGEDGRLYHYFHPDDSDMVYKCYYTIPEGETDWSNIDYSSPEDIEINDSWGYSKKRREREMKPFKTIRTPEGWYVGVAIDGKLFGRKVELGQPTAETLANSLDGWYRDNGREWLEGEIKKGYLTEIPRSTLIMGNGMKGWQDRQDVLWEKVLKDRL